MKIELHAATDTEAGKVSLSKISETGLLGHSFRTEDGGLFIGIQNLNAEGKADMDARFYLTEVEAQRILHALNSKARSPVPEKLGSPCNSYIRCN
jgi:hypothetical protein